MERRNISVPKAHGGEAVARILHDGLGVPHSTAKGLIDAGCVTINGRPARSHGQRCEGGDVVEVRFDPKRNYEPRPPLRHGPGFRVIHEDLEIVVVDKTPGLLSSPAPGRRDESLAELIAESLRSRGIKKPQLFVVHRLDQHTSGLLAFARTPRAMEWMAAQFESREAGRVYTAVVSGRVERERGTIQSWLVENPKSLSVHTTPTRGAGKRAITHFAVQERFDDATVVRVGLETGRKHQIRVHFAEIGHPVLGDRRYGEPSSDLPRVALHAERLTFRHPRTLERVTFEAPWPEDLTKLVQRLRRGGAASAGSGAGNGADRGAVAEAAAPAPEAAAPRAGSPFGRSRGPEVVTRAEVERRSAARLEGRRGPHAPMRVQVFPQGLTLTDPMGPTAAHLMDPIAGRTEAGPAPGGRAGRPVRGFRGPAPRGPSADRPPRDERPARSDRPSRDERPAREVRPGGDSIERRERLLRERSVGSRPPQRRSPTGGNRPPERSGTDGPAEDGRVPWKRESTSAPRRGVEPGRPAAGPPRKHWEGRPKGAKPWAGKPDGARPPAGKPDGAKPWSGKPREAKPWSGKPEGKKPWSGKPEGARPSSGRPGPDGARPWSGKPNGAKPWIGKPREAKPWSGKPVGKKPWSGKPAGARPSTGRPDGAHQWSGKPEGAKPWIGKPRETKPWSGKPEGKRPWSGKPEGARPSAGRPVPDGARRWSGKPDGAKPWIGKPREGKPWSGMPEGKKPWRGKPSPAGPPAAKSGASSPAGSVPHKARHAEGAAGARKPWEFSQKGSTLRRERRRKIAGAQAKGQGKGKKR